MRLFKFFGVFYNFIYGKDHILPITPYNQAYYQYLCSLDDVMKNEKQDGLLTMLYRHLFESFSAMSGLEGETIKLEPYYPMNLESFVGLPTNLDLVHLIAIDMYYSYPEKSWEDGKKEIATIYMKRILEYLSERIINTIHNGNIFKKIHKGNYRSKDLFINKDLERTLEKIEFVLKMESRQKLVYIVGRPGTGKTTTLIDYLIKKGYFVYYVNGNNVLLGEHPKSTIIHILGRLKNEILLLPIKKRRKTILIFDECEVAMKEVKQLDKLLEDLGNKEDVVSNLSKSQTQKEKALTICMLDLFSIKDFLVVCISNSLKISPYMERRITHLVKFAIESPEDYIDMWKKLLYQHNITFNEGEVGDLIHAIGMFSFEKKISIRTIKQFVVLFSGQRISLKTLFQYCARIEE